MHLHSCEDLGEITVVAVTHIKGEPRRKYFKTQFGPTPHRSNDVMHAFKNIAGNIVGIDTVERYNGHLDADFVVTMTHDVTTSKQASELLDHLLRRVTALLDRELRNARNTPTAMALHSETTREELLGR